MSDGSLLPMNGKYRYYPGNKAPLHIAKTEREEGQVRPKWRCSLSERTAPYPALLHPAQSGAAAAVIMTTSSFYSAPYYLLHFPLSLHNASGDRYTYVADPSQIDAAKRVLKVAPIYREFYISDTSSFSLDSYSFGISFDSRVRRGREEGRGMTRQNTIVLHRQNRHFTTVRPYFWLFAPLA